MDGVGDEGGDGVEGGGVLGFWGGGDGAEEYVGCCVGGAVEVFVLVLAGGGGLGRGDGVFGVEEAIIAGKATG